jgi:hypothetical protein
MGPAYETPSGRAMMTLEAAAAMHLPMVAK